MTRAAAWEQKKAPRRFRSRWRSKADGVVAVKGVRSKRAALLTSTSSRPRARAIARPTRTAPPVTSARGRSDVMLEFDMLSRLRTWFKVRFIAGFFFTVPVFLTAWLLWIFWNRIDDVFAPMYEKILGRPLPARG